MLDPNLPMELYNAKDGRTLDVTSARKDSNGRWLVGPSTPEDGWVNYNLDGSAYITSNPWVLRNKKVDVNLDLVKLINDAGWCIASLGQDDNFKWGYEIREGYATSYNLVQIKTGFGSLEDALRDAFEQIAKVNKLRATATELGITGKVVF